RTCASPRAFVAGATCGCRNPALQEEPNVAEREAERDDIRQKIDVMITTLKGAGEPAVAGEYHDRGAVAEFVAASLPPCSATTGASRSGRWPPVRSPLRDLHDVRLGS